MSERQVAEPLVGRRIILTAQRRADEFAGALERRGAVVVHAPTMSHVSHADDDQLRSRIEELVDDPPGRLVVTTGVGFRELLDAARTFGLETPWRNVLERTSILVRGPKARGAVLGAGFPVAWTAGSETAAEIVDHLLQEPLTGSRIAVQHHGAGSDGLDDTLRAAGADVVPLVVYRWGPSPDPASVRRAVAAVAEGRADCIAFTAAPGVRAFLDAAREAGRYEEVAASLREGRVLTAAVGDTTAAPLRALGCRPLVPERFRLGALVRVLENALAPQDPEATHG